MLVAESDGLMLTDVVEERLPRPEAVIVRNTVFVLVCAAELVNVTALVAVITPTPDGADVLVELSLNVSARDALVVTENVAIGDPDCVLLSDGDTVTECVGDRVTAIDWLTLADTVPVLFAVCEAVGEVETPGERLSCMLADGLLDRGALRVAGSEYAIVAAPEGVRLISGDLESVSAAEDERVRTGLDDTEVVVVPVRVVLNDRDVDGDAVGDIEMRALREEDGLLVPVRVTTDDDVVVTVRVSLKEADGLPDCVRLIAGLRDSDGELDAVLD